MQTTEIPKIIHYCWFGHNPLPPIAKKCIASWKKYLPDYEIKEWNESNFDVDSVPYTKEAYKAGKYAFVSDYARFKILYENGGVYFDTDVEVIKPMDDIISSGPFMGRENEYIPGNSPETMGVAAGLGLGVTPRLPLYKEILEMYESIHFENPDKTLNLKTVVEYITNLLCEKGLVNSPDIQEIEGVMIYPKEYFCPIDYLSGKKALTSNTRTIHHYASSWFGPKEKIGFFLQKTLGKKNFEKLMKIVHKFGL